MPRPKLQPDLREPSGLVGRFNLPDLASWGGWLVGRLQKRYPNVNDRTIFGWLKGLIYSNEYLFIRSDNAIALFEAVHRPLEAAHIVQEIFVLSRDGKLEEAAALYVDARRWAEGMGAAEMLIEQFTDVPREMIQGIGRVLLRDMSFVRIPKAPI